MITEQVVVRRELHVLLGAFELTVTFYDISLNI